MQYDTCARIKGVLSKINVDLVSVSVITFTAERMSGPVPSIPFPQCCKCHLRWMVFGRQQNRAVGITSGVKV